MTRDPMRRSSVILAASFLVLFSPPLSGLPAEVLQAQKIAGGVGGLDVSLEGNVFFGIDVASLGDLDGDGVPDIAVGSHTDNDGGTTRGAVYVLFLNTDGTVKAHQKISSTSGGFAGPLEDDDRFGSAVESLGDLDGDGVGDLAVAAPYDSSAGTRRGAIWILFLDADGTVKGQQKISGTSGGFTGALDDNDQLGFHALASLGDLDGDGVGDLAVGARHDDDGGGHQNAERGAVWVLFLNADGTVKAHQKISQTEGGFLGTLHNNDRFAFSLAHLGDLDGDGIADLAAGARNDRDGGLYRGAVWILFLDSDGTVQGHQKISSLEGGFTGSLDDGDHFGSAVGSLGDVDGDGIADLAVGAYGDDDGGTDRGAVWILSLDDGGTVRSQEKISDAADGFPGLADGDFFGVSLASPGDFDGDGGGELVAGADRDGFNQGAVWVLFLEGSNRPPSADAGDDETVECTAALRTPVELDGSGSSDPDGDPLAYEWTFDDGGRVFGVAPTVLLPLGTYPVTLTVDDGRGGSDSDEVVVSVADTTPPAIESAAADPDVLWPPNHRMRRVTVEVASADLCDPAPPDCRITDVARNEPVDGHGDGNTAPDWEITGDLAADLRAERSGSGDGRIYTLEIACGDAAGNTSTTTTAVTVPNDRRR